MNNCGEPIAHISEDGRCQRLEDHLRGVSELASQFAKEFGASEWAGLAGMWHDLGKYSSEFQDYIRGKPGRVDHSTCGAVKACDKFGKYGRILAYLIAGHHAGLPDWQSAESGMSGLAQRLKNNRIPQSDPPKEILSMNLPSEKPKKVTDPSMWIRMLFSCLVDADFLDTETFMEPDKNRIRGNYPTTDELLKSFNDYMNNKTVRAENTEVNKLRADVLKQCVLKAPEKPSVFSLTVPTGGGKTLSSMAFALNHAVKHGKRRIIYVIPYTSIIEQSADQFREIFGDAVIEHHSNVDVQEDGETFNKQKLASENWDAPIIVTTSVQFFESLYAARSGRCRKLHNIVNSVVILDEIQLLPPDYLNPILAALKELHKNYGVTLLLSTATQPALGSRQTSDFRFEGIPDIKEIIGDPESLNKKLKRVRINVHSDLKNSFSWDELAKELSGHEKVLCVVNRRDDCRRLHRLMPEGTTHLSALMCGAHRSEVIADIKKRLEENVPIRVISTQLVEAGVDLDFPVVYRALSGLDSIAQAAGRCNREGLLTEGVVKVFIPESEIPSVYLSQAAEICRSLLSKETNDPFTLKRFAEYFKELYWLRGDKLDAKGILNYLSPDNELRFSFRTAAEKFHIIDDSKYIPVLVRYDEGSKWIDILVKKGPERWLMRKLQRYVVNIPRYLRNKMIREGVEGVIEEPYPSIYIQSSAGLYYQDIGFCYESGGVIEPDDLVV